MIYLTGVLVNAFAYLATGWFLAVRDMPNAWERARREWDDSSAFAWEYVYTQSRRLMLGWIVIVPLRLLRRRFYWEIEQSRHEPEDQWMVQGYWP